MYHKYQTEGVVIKGFDSGDSSRKILLLTSELGLIFAHVQSVRGLKSKLRGSTQDFTLGSFVLVKGANGWRLTGAEKHQDIFASLRADSSRLRALSNILNMAKSLLEEEHGNPKIFETVKYFVLNFKNVPSESAELAEYAAIMKILHELGALRSDPRLSEWAGQMSFSEGLFNRLSENRVLARNLINEGLEAVRLKL